MLIPVQFREIVFLALIELILEHLFEFFVRLPAHPCSRQPMTGDSNEILRNELCFLSKLSKFFANVS